MTYTGWMVIAGSVVLTIISFLLAYAWP